MTNRCAFLDSEKEPCIWFYTTTVGNSALYKLLPENDTCIFHVSVFDARTVTKPSHLPASPQRTGLFFLNPGLPFTR